MKNIILIFTILICFSACSQKKETMINQNPNITANNIVEEIAKEVKYFPQEKVYNLEYENYYCRFDVLVNDIPIRKNFDKPLGGSALEINQNVFKNGIQKVTYKIYPAGKIEDQDEEYKTLKDITYLKFELSSYDLKNEDANDVNYMEYKTPSTEVKISEAYSEQKFDGAGKTYYEGSFDINVDVPYNLNPPFENAQNLRKFDQKILEAKLLAEYKKISSVYQNKEYDNMARLAYDNLKSTYISSYTKKEDIKKEWEQKIKMYKSSEIEM